VCKISINGGDWQTAGVVSPTQPIAENGVNITNKLNVILNIRFKQHVAIYFIPNNSFVVLLSL